MQKMLGAGNGFFSPNFNGVVLDKSWLGGVHALS